MEPIIELRDVTKYYPKAKRYRDLVVHPFKRDYVSALKNVSLSVIPGSILGLLGPNGAGKTTLIKILATLVHPSSGKAFIKGYDVVRDGDKVRRTIGLVATEERSFYFRLTGRQNLDFYGTLNNLSSEERTRRINAVLHETELEDAGERMFMDYSSGMKQRLAIARGLLCDPDIILLDEPTRSLDPHSAKHLRSLIRDKVIREKKRTALLSTHNLQEAKELCTHIAVIDQGSIIFSGPIDDIHRLTDSPAYVLRLASPFPITAISALPSVQSVSADADDPLILKLTTEDIALVMRYVLDQGGLIEECYRHKASLEDVFSDLVEKTHCASGPHP